MEFVEYKSPIPPRLSALTIVAQDPSVRDETGALLTATVRVPTDYLEPGPRSHRFHVIDYDATTATLSQAMNFEQDQVPKLIGENDSLPDHLTKKQEASLLKSFTFHAQNTYAIAARTLGSFESALGRRLPWAFGNHQLFLLPHAFAEANAYYAGDDNAILFGYFPGIKGATVYTCLAHDVVAHETTHACLDGLRPRFVEPGLPDQAAFHEAFADVVALLSVFSVRKVVERLLGKADDRGRIPASDVSPTRLRDSALFKLAEEMGEATSGERGSALRRSVQLEPSEAWTQDLAFEEPHRRGEVLVAAVMQTLLKMWTQRLEALIFGDGLDRKRAAEEGAKAADHLLRMAIRAIDYCPPIEFEFADFVDAVLVSDAVVAPDDEHHYRDAISEAFELFGIRAPDRQIVDLTKLTEQPAYDNVNFASLRSDRDEVFRFIWQNADLFELDRRYTLRVQSVRPSVRVGPDGFVVSEAVADYVQMLDAKAKELEAIGVELPDGLDPATEVQLWGGGVIVFDQFGQAKFHQTKPLGDWDRQTRRLAYLVRNGLKDTKGRVGFSFGTPRGQRFAEFHEPDSRAGERW